MIKKYLTKVFNYTFGIIISLFILSNWTSFEVKNQLIKSFIYFGIIFMPPLILIWNLIIIKRLKYKLLSLILPMIGIAIVVKYDALNILFSSGSWKTQTIVYENKSDNSKRVEFQMQNVGALGYNKRTVEVNYITGLFMIIKPVEKDIDENENWKKVNKDVNEHELKY